MLGLVKKKWLSVLQVISEVRIFVYLNKKALWLFMYILALFSIWLSDKIGLLSTNITSILFGLYIVISDWEFVNMWFD